MTTSDMNFEDFAQSIRARRRRSRRARHAIRGAGQLALPPQRRCSIRARRSQRQGAIALPLCRVDTTLASAAGAGATSITLADASTFALQYGIMIVGAGAAGAKYIGQITAKSGNVLTISPPTSTAVSAGAAVRHDDTDAIKAAIDIRSRTEELSSSREAVTASPRRSPSALASASSEPAADVTRKLASPPWNGATSPPATGIDARRQHQLQSHPGNAIARARPQQHSTPPESSATTALTSRVADVLVYGWGIGANYYGVQRPARRRRDHQLLRRLPAAARIASGSPASAPSTPTQSRQHASTSTPMAPVATTSTFYDPIDRRVRRHRLGPNR